MLQWLRQKTEYRVDTNQLGDDSHVEDATGFVPVRSDLALQPSLSQDF
jgi:hypothetical protein